MNLQQSVRQPGTGDVELQSSSSTEDDVSVQSQDSLSVQCVQSEDIPLRFPIEVSTSSLALEPQVSSVDISSHQPILNGTIRVEGSIVIDDEKKREHKRRSKNWTHAETLKLVQLRTELDERFRRSGKKAMLWEEISLALQKEKISRDGQQCKDKWEKLTAAYKEVRDGSRDKTKHPFFDELNALFSWKSYKKEADCCEEGGDAKQVKFEVLNTAMPSWSQQGMPHGFSPLPNTIDLREVHSNTEVKDARYNHSLNEAQKQAPSSPGKRKRDDVIPLFDYNAMQSILDSVITRQQRFLKDLLDALDRKEQLKEQMWHEREEKWRAEERAQRFALNSALIRLMQKLLGEQQSTGVTTDIVPCTRTVATTSKKRSKNWKKSEVSNLIQLRQEMESKFVSSTRRAGLWDELGEKLASLGTHRDGKQCREKWDKLMAEYKDVMDGRKDKDESHYFAQLSEVMGRMKDGDNKSSSEITKDECVVDRLKEDNVVAANG
ncbi:hypothetical protein KP509_36G011200 [Ceratopteris richardii]|uniref:Myb-like domain-containing protein n=1 Tax=Ceratopteris richardii TaxID=49495 RepID=A0A8T2QB40_CERRI|nr:hypothetical protein KP509_36G011200 [Ceratopteris richardii]KAH7280723.1 hypothetical protein KP509_36G011200 [Ceratopteris richardii]